jgi:DNA primase
VRNQGKEKMTELIENALSYPRFVYVTQSPPYDKLSPREKENVLMELVNISAQSDSSIRRELFLKEVSSIFDINLESLKTELDKSSKKAREQKEPEKKKEEYSISQKIQVQILAVLLENMNLLEKSLLELSEEDFTDARIREIYKKMLMLRSKNPSIDATYLLNHISDPEEARIISYASNMELGTKDIERLFSDFAMRLKQINIEDKRRELIAKIVESERSGDQKKAQEYTDQLTRLTEKLTSTGEENL